MAQVMSKVKGNQNEFAKTFVKNFGDEEKRRKFIDALSPNHSNEIYLEEFVELAYWVDFEE